MNHVLILGAGKIGTLVACLLANTPDYKVSIVDRVFTEKFWLDDKNPLIPKMTVKTADIQDFSELQKLHDELRPAVVISALPFYLNQNIVDFAKLNKLHYLDLTEDVKNTEYVKLMAASAESAFIPQCGLAPGFVGLVAHELMQYFEEIDTVSLRVGALPQTTNNNLFYSLTWSIDGLINEYLKPCLAISQGHSTFVPPLEQYQTHLLDGQLLEAFNTSGGLGNLPELCLGKVKNMDYKTLRYPGHCEKMKFLLHDLKLARDLPLLKDILRKAIPQSEQDVVYIYVSVNGVKHKQFIEKHYFKKVYPQDIAGHHWSAIQVTTATGLCTILDLFLANPNAKTGFIYQEQFSLAQFLANRFGKLYA